MKKNVIRQLANVIVPTIVFYGVYRVAGILPALILSLLFSVFNAAYAYAKEKRIPNTQLFGIIGLVLSTIGILFTNNEKLYYLPALASNCILFCFAVGLTIRRKSIFHYVTRDFHITSLKEVSEASLISLNIAWLLFFLIKIVSKLVGMFFLSFQEMYWLVFMLGDPMTILVVVYSVYRINRAIGKKETISGSEHS